MVEAPPYYDLAVRRQDIGYVLDLRLDRSKLKGNTVLQDVIRLDTGNPVEPSLFLTVVGIVRADPSP